MLSLRTSYYWIFALSVTHQLAQSLTPPIMPTSTRRAALISSAVWILPIATKDNARLVMNEETGDYDDVVDEDWQTAWKQRLDKASAMSADEIVMAARGAGNRIEGTTESEASRKRRAMAGCRDKTFLKKAGFDNEKACTAKVIQGDVALMLKAMGF
jgi:hypothetical protein